MAREFHVFAGCEALGLGLDEADLRETFGELATSGASLLVVAEDGRGLLGMLAALLVPWYARKTDVIAQEVWWWVDPGRRDSGAGLALLRELERWAGERGARVVHLATPRHEDLDLPMGRLFRRQGYRRIETAWGKAVS